MEDFQMILDEISRMEDASRKRERTRRLRAIERKRQERRRKQLTLLGIVLCCVLTAPLITAVSAHLRPASVAEAETLAVSAPSDESAAPVSLLVGDESVAALDDMDAFRAEDLSAVDDYAGENPENIPPSEAVDPYVWSLADLADFLTETPKGFSSAQSPQTSQSSDAPSTSSSSQRFAPKTNAKTITLGESAEIGSKYAVLLDAETGYIRAERNSDVKVSPASMTKVLTLLVATEKLIKVTPEGVKGMDTKVTITRPVTNYCYTNNCSVAGFATWETVTVRDLLYGCILPSGADACLALARHISGSQEAFVELMNQKLQQLGISDTAHFTNCIGLYNKDHYCTMRDMAVIMKAAMDHSICRVILNARRFRTSSTAEHPNGISLSNLFLRRIEDRFEGTSLYIQGAKTGYVNQSGNCAVSYATSQDGKKYICVTGKAAGSWRAVYDHTLLYRAYCLN